MAEKALRVGLLGFGTVGRGTALLLKANADVMAARTGLPLILQRIGERTPAKVAGHGLDDVEVTDDVARIVEADDIDAVVELIGGLEPARSFVARALKAGKHVVTANKALIAHHGPELLELARENRVELLFEAAVAGAIPILKGLKESLAANNVNSVYGILNGTCNYILTQMRVHGQPFDEVLKAAQELGYAEADPTFDVEGIDAAHKLAILASISFDMPLAFDQVNVEGIRHVSDVDIKWATEMGYRIKLLGIAKRVDGKVEMRVQPTLVSAESMVAAVEGVFNAVFVNGDHAGTTMHYGRGAGEQPTASAVVGDLIDVARNARIGAVDRVAGLSCRPENVKAVPIGAMDDLEGEYYLRLAVTDKPGVLADITAILKKFEISIEALRQEGRSPGESVPLVIVTHDAREKSIQSALAEIADLEAVQEPPRLIRIEEIPD